MQRSYIAYYERIRRLKKLEKWDKVMETTLSHVWRLWQDAKQGEGRFAIISAYKENTPEEVNKANEWELMQKVRSLGYGYFALTGHYSNKPEVLEQSIWVNDIPLADAIRLGEEPSSDPNSRQESILYVGPETSGSAMLYYMDGGTHNFGPFHPDRMGEFYSRLHGRGDRPFYWQWECFGLAANEYKAITDSGQERFKTATEELLHEFREMDWAEKADAAYWISPEGEVIAVEGGNRDPILSAVIKRPRRFGYTLPEIQEIFTKHGEIIGGPEKHLSSQKARMEINRSLLEDGWIRARRYDGRHWSVVVKDLNSVARDRLWDWGNKIQEGLLGFKEVDLFFPVKVVDLAGNIVDYEVGSIAKDALYEGVTVTPPELRSTIWSVATR